MRNSLNMYQQTTELCAKQDAYYREVVSELENRLKESVAGRDHVLALRYMIHAAELAYLYMQFEISEKKRPNGHSYLNTVVFLEHIQFA